MVQQLLVSIFHRFPILTKKFLSGKGFVFMLHRILPEDQRNKYVWNKSLAISPEGLENWIKFFKSKGFDIISMDEVIERINSKKSKKFVAFTIDDGYKDNLVHGLPILEKHEVPCTIYVSNCFPNNKAVYWWYFLEEYIQKSNSINLSPIGIDYFKEYSPENQKEIYDEIREILRKSDYNTHCLFAKEICGIKNLEEINESLNLSWSEVKKISENPLISIGGHTCHHVSLKNQNTSTFKREICNGTRELSRQIGQDVHHFAYPYGSLDDVNVNGIMELKKNNYSSAVLNHPGSIFKGGKKSNFIIPRMGLTDETSKGRIDDLFLGKIHLRFNGVKKSIL